MRKPKKATPFLDLPAQMRNRIYELTYKDTIAMLDGRGWWTKPLGLLGTCRQTRKQALNIFYEQSIFQASGAYTAYRFLSSVPSASIHFIQAIRISWLPSCMVSGNLTARTAARAQQMLAARLAQQGINVELSVFYVYLPHVSAEHAVPEFWSNDPRRDGGTGRPLERRAMFVNRGPLASSRTKIEGLFSLLPLSVILYTLYFSCHATFELD
jgi:hypothetical protein